MEPFDIEKWREENRKYDREQLILMCIGIVIGFVGIALTLSAL
jgi:hypothetical protein